MIPVDGSIPAPPGHFDEVISLNTFEHILNGDRSLDAISRVVRPGGKLHLAVPFLYRVHGHPDDFVRGTPSYWQAKLNQAGFDRVTVKALHWGNFTTAATIASIGPIRRVRFGIAMLLDLLRNRGKSGELGLFKQDHPSVASPLGYWITAYRTE